MSALFALLLVATPCGAFCPSRCSCDDVELEARCVDAGLDVVPIQLNPEVRRISLRGNRIANVHFSLEFYSNLNELDVSRNRLSSLGEGNFLLQTKLLSLNVSDNDVVALAGGTFQGLRMLRSLDLSRNRLETVSTPALAGLRGLRDLRLMGNRISSLDHGVFAELTHLSHLWLDDNQLLSVPSTSLQSLQSLESLGLSSNLIETIDGSSFSTLRSLRFLTLQWNFISVVHDEGFHELHALRSLNLSDNNLTWIPSVQLSNLRDLEDLDLSGNSFSAIGPRAFQDLGELRSLRLCRLSSLKRVDVDAFAGNAKLKSLFLDLNGALTSLPVRLFETNAVLREISARHNAFVSLEASQFPLEQLKSLVLAGNPLHCNCSLLWLWLLASRQAVNLSSENDTLRLDARSIRCGGPGLLRNRILSDLDASDLHCGLSWSTTFISSLVLIALLIAVCGGLVIVTRRKFKEKRLHHQNGDPLQLQRQYSANVCSKSPNETSQDYSTSYVLRSHWDTIGTAPMFYSTAEKTENIFHT